MFNLHGESFFLKFFLLSLCLLSGKWANMVSCGVQGAVLCSHSSMLCTHAALIQLQRRGLLHLAKAQPQLLVPVLLRVDPRPVPICLRDYESSSKR